MATLREAIDFARKSPSEPKSQQLLEGLKSGSFDGIAEQEGIDLGAFKSKFATDASMENSVADKRSVFEREGVPEKGFFAKGIEGVKKGFTEGGGKAFVDPFIGAAKGVATGISGAAELGQKGLQAITPGGEQEIAKIPERFTEAEGGFQKAGKFVEQVAELAVPLGAAAKVTKVGKGLKGLQKAKAVGKTALAQGLTSGAVAAAQEGEVGGDAALAAGIGAAFPIASAGIKSIFKPLIDKGRLVKKATGISSTLKGQVDDVAQSQIKVGGKTKKAYNSIDDFFIEEGFFKNGAKTTRDDFVQHADDLLNQTKTSKAKVFEGVKTKIPVKKIPNYRKVLNQLDDGFRTIGQEEDLGRIQGLIKSKSNSVSAKDLEFVRSRADKLLFSLTDKPKQEGLRKVLGKFRDILQDVETSGEVKKANVKIRILSQLLGVGKKSNPLKAAAEKGAKGSIVFDLLGGASAGLIGSGVPVVGPVLGPALGAIGAAEAVTASPQVSSFILNRLSKEVGKKITPKLIQTLLKSGAIEGSTNLGE